MIPYSQEKIDAARAALRATLAEEQASGQPPDTAWADDLPSDPLPEEDDETSVTIIQK